MALPPTEICPPASSIGFVGRDAGSVGDTAAVAWAYRYEQTILIDTWSRSAWMEALHHRTPDAGDQDPPW